MPGPGLYNLLVLRRVFHLSAFRPVTCTLCGVILVRFGTQIKYQTHSATGSYIDRWFKQLFWKQGLPFVF